MFKQELTKPTRENFCGTVSRRLSRAFPFVNKIVIILDQLRPDYKLALREPPNKCGTRKEGMPRKQSLADC
jgi:hypothetical protein